MNSWSRLDHNSSEMGASLLNELLSEKIKLSNLDRLPYGMEETKIMMGIVYLQKNLSQHLMDIEQMIEVRTGVILACEAITAIN